jgi:hypothetical protein
VPGSNGAHFVDPDEPEEPQSPVAAVKTGMADKKIPEGAQVWYDNATGAAIGYRTADGKHVPLS